MEPEVRPDDLRHPVSLLLVDAVDPKTIHALQYAKSLRSDLIAVHVERDPLEALELETAWSAANLHQIPLIGLNRGGDTAERIAGFAAHLEPGRPVNVVIPVPPSDSVWRRMDGSRTAVDLIRAFRHPGQVHVTLLRFHGDGTHPIHHDEQGHPILRLAPREHAVAVLVDRLDAPVIEAIRFAMTLGATEVWAVHAGIDRDNVAALTAGWMNSAMPIPLDVVECWHRNVARTLEAHVLAMAERSGEVTVVIPRRDLRNVRRLFHGRTASKIQKALGRHEHVEVTIMPWSSGPVRSLPSLAARRTVR